MEGFTFWRSYYNAIKQATPEDAKALIVAICDYMFNDEEPDLQYPASSVFEAVRGNLDKSKKKSRAGAAGGSARGNRQDETENKQTEEKESITEKDESTLTRTRTRTCNEEEDKDEKPLPSPRKGQEDGGSGGKPITASAGGTAPGTNGPARSSSSLPADGLGPGIYKPLPDAAFNRLRRERMAAVAKMGQEAVP